MKPSQCEQGPGSEKSFLGGEAANVVLRNTFLGGAAANVVLTSERPVWIVPIKFNLLSDV